MERYRQLLRRSLDRLMSSENDAANDDDDFIEGFRQYRQSASSRRQRAMYTFRVFYTEPSVNVMTSYHGRRLREQERGPKKVVVERGSSVDDLKQRILQVFPVSTATNLILKKCRQDNGYRLVPVEAVTLHQLKKELGRGALYAMPPYGDDLPNPTLVTVPAPVDMAESPAPVVIDDLPNPTPVTVPAPVDMVEPPAPVVIDDVPNPAPVTRPADQALADMAGPPSSEGLPVIPPPTVRRRTFQRAQANIAGAVADLNEITRTGRQRNRTRLRRRDPESHVTDDLPNPATVTVPSDRAPEDMVVLPAPDVNDQPEDMDQVQTVSDVRNNQDLSSDFQTALLLLQSSLSGAEQKSVIVRRSHIVEDVLSIYKSSDILMYMLHVEFEGEAGEDFGGLTKDMFSTFWKAAWVEFFKGEDAVVPFLPVHRRRDAPAIYPSLGRILCHQLSLVGVFPPKLCRTSLLAKISGQEVENELLLEDFLKFVSVPERFLLKEALQTTFWPESVQRRLISLFSVYGMHVIPSTEQLRDQVLDIANNELLDKPAHLLSLMKQGLSEFSLVHFFSQISPASLTTFYNSLLPSCDLVANALRPDKDIVSASEDIVLYYLDTFVRELSMEALETFLLYVTGSSLMPTDGIKVTFNSTSGLARRPVSHTCGNVIELSTAYSSYQEFKQEILHVLNCDEAFEMSAI